MQRSNVLFRINAGMNTGLGHLTRCLNIARELQPFADLYLCIYTENRHMVESYLQLQLLDIPIKEVIYLTSSEVENDVEGLVCYLKERQAFLVLDHYDVTEKYQRYLKQAGIHWLQLDSHAKMRFYGDLVQHGSPGATDDLYASLHGSKDTVFLLGPRYCIVNEDFSRLHHKAMVRKEIQNVLISFGGGYAKGALLKYIDTLAASFQQLSFHLVFRGSHPDSTELENISGNHSNVNLHIDSNHISELMLLCDVGVFAPGGMSYEAATLGLPLILIAIEDNQFVNLKGCAQMGISYSLGSIEDVAPEHLCLALSDLLRHPEKVSEMSFKALKEFDGHGAARIAEAIQKRIKEIQI